MKNKKLGFLLVSLMVIATLFVLVACEEHSGKPNDTEGCEHKWTEATCTAAKTCSVCNVTEGEALGHTWVEANCTTAKTCSVCNVTEGEALGHTWVEATCTAPKTCSVCEDVEGEALGHNMTTLSNFCTVCGEFEYYELRAVRCAIERFGSLYDEYQKEGYIDNFEILNVYYVVTNNCQCAYCDDYVYEGVEKGTAGVPYITVFIIFQETVGLNTEKHIEASGIHQLHEEGTDTYYSVTGYGLQYWFYYTGNEIDKVYAQDYSFYYEKADLTLVDMRTVMSDLGTQTEQPDQETEKETETEGPDASEIKYPGDL